MEHISSNKAQAFFVDGPGGTGKTFLYRALLATVRSRNLVALATASSGVAASILSGGRTAHSRFKLPLDANETTSCSVSKQSSLANLLRASKLIIWDEAPMTRKQHIETLDKMLRDINDSDTPFGGKVIIFGGDFRQVLPVVRKGTRQEQVIAIAYVELDDNTKSLSAVMFADIVEKIFSCNAAQLMNYTAEEHRRFVDTTIINLSKKK
ncbi:hypothetical protein CsatB_007807 [Cannabis sativa]